MFLWGVTHEISPFDTNQITEDYNVNVEWRKRMYRGG